jgi:distribution and morphology protein 31
VDAFFYMPKNYRGETRDDKVRVKVHMNLNHLTASVPMGDQQISYLNSALVQPMVIYLNSNWVSVPIEANLAIPIEYYDGAWSPYGACMTDALSEAVGVELSRKTADQKKPRNMVWLLIKGVDGVWRGAKHTLYLLWHGYVFQP